MANALAELFGNIAESIRGGLPDTGKMKPVAFPDKIDEIVRLIGTGGEVIEGVDPYYQKLAEAVITRNAEDLSGDKTTLPMKGFVTSSGSTLASVNEYAFAGFVDVENIIISDTLFVYENAFAGCRKLKILDITASSTISTVGFFGNSLSGCTALESVIVRDGGCGIEQVLFNKTNMGGIDLGGVGANDTFYVYVPAAYYDTIVEKVNASSITAVPSSRYRKLEEYPAVDKWNETYTVNFYDGDKLADTKVVKYGQTATSSYVKDGYTLVGWTPEPVNVTEDMNCYGSWTISLESASWETVAAISEAGNAADVFSLGATKTFTCNGYTYTAEIAGFGVDTRSDGSGKAGITFIVKELYRTSVQHTANAPNSSVSKWSASTLRTYCNGTLYSGLQSELKAVVKPVNKITSNNWDAETTVDYCWPLNVYEVGGSMTYESASPKYSTIFSDNNSRKRTTASGTQTFWHLRTVNSARMSYFVDKSGAVKYNTYQQSAYPFVFGFCV